MSSNLDGLYKYYNIHSRILYELNWIVANGHETMNIALYEITADADKFYKTRIGIPLSNKTIIHYLNDLGDKTFVQRLSKFSIEEWNRFYLCEVFEGRGIVWRKDK